MFVSGSFNRMVYWLTFDSNTNLIHSDLENDDQIHFEIELDHFSSLMADGFVFALS